MSDSPWMNTADVAERLRYTGKYPLRSVYKFIARHGLVVRHDGRRVLLARADVDRAIDGDAVHVRTVKRCSRAVSAVNSSSHQGAIQ